MNLGAAQRFRLYVNASARWEGKPLYQAVVATARTLHLAGASVFAVDRSYGHGRTLRDSTSDYLSADVPVVIEVIDSVARIQELCDHLGPMLAAGFATIEPVRVLHYSPHEDRPGPAV